MSLLPRVVYHLFQNQSQIITIVHRILHNLSFEPPPPGHLLLSHLTLATLTAYYIYLY